MVGIVTTIGVLWVGFKHAYKWGNKVHVSRLEKRALIATELEKEQIRKRRSAARRYYRGLSRNELLNKHNEFCFILMKFDDKTERYYPFGNTLLRDTERGMKDGSGEYERVVTQDDWLEHRFTWRCEKHERQHYLTLRKNASTGSGGCTDWCGD